MPRIWCSECGTFVVGELMPGGNLLEQGHVLSPPCAACVGCEKENAMKIIRVSREPFCPNCGGCLEMQEDIRTVYDPDTDKLLGFMMLCPWCGEALMPSKVGWRDRENGEAE